MTQIVVSPVDLHSHSTFSDGALSPEELVQRALARHLKLLALTDHDASGGVESAVKAAKGSSLQVIAGAELSTTWLNCQIHIVGLFLNLHSQELLDFYQGQRERRIERAQAIGAKLERQGFHDAYARTCAMADPGALITRGNYARFIFSVGQASSIDDAFNSYLKKGKSAYVNTVWPSVGEAVAVIKASGGIAVLAHPKRYLLTNTKLRRLIEEFKDAGGEAMEVASCRQRPCDRVYLGELCERYGLYASMGSDYHQGSPWLDLGLGLTLPDGLTPVWECPQAQELKLDEFLRS